MIKEAIRHIDVAFLGVVGLFRAFRGMKAMFDGDMTDEGIVLWTSVVRMDCGQEA